MPAVPHPSAENLISLTLPELVEYRLRHNPDDVFTLFPGASVDENPCRITYLEFGRGVQRFARAVRSQLTLKEGDVVGIIAECDPLMYITAILGLLHNSVTAFPMSPRNSKAASISLLRQVSVHHVIFSHTSVKPMLDQVNRELAADGHHIDAMQLPLFSCIYPRLAAETKTDPFEPFPFTLRDRLINNVALYIHSSGSTGFPKPIPWTTEFINRFYLTDLVIEMTDLPSGTVVASPGIPSFHAMGVIRYMLLPLMSLTIGGMIRPSYPNIPHVPSAQAIVEALRAIRANAAAMVPSILEELSYDDGDVAYLSTLINVTYTGGPLAQAIGDKLVRAGCHIKTTYGSTEIGIVGSFLSPAHAAPEDWQWTTFGKNVSVRWVGQTNGPAELCLLPCITHIPAVQNMPGPEGGYATNDIWIPHPTKTNLWKLVGRADDLLVLANGEKVLPGPTEGAVSVHPWVQGAVMFGRERTHVGILVEPMEMRAFDPADDSTLAAFRNNIWATVEEANKTLPAFGRLYKEMILVTNPSKPLPRAAKGTVNRRAAIKAYEDEINTIYEAAERVISVPSMGSGPLPEWTGDHVLDWLRELANSIHAYSDIKVDIDLFQQGFDSLSATFLRNSITAALRASSNISVKAVSTKVGPNFVYVHPKLKDMATVLVALLHAESDDDARNPAAAVDAMVRRYTQNMPSIRHSQGPKPTQNVVLLTGSTGGLGSQLLVGLIEKQDVTKVYVLNRPSVHLSSLERHLNTFRDRGLDLGLLKSPKLVFMEGDAAAEYFNLSSELYEELRSSVSLIIHNAWQLNFNLGLTAFEPQVHSARRLVDLAFTSAHAEHVRIVFTSSIAVAQSWPHKCVPFPEEPQDNGWFCIGNGYGEAKYVVEQILVKAADHGLQTTSLRIGQISGGIATGAWATTDWVPIMLATSVSLGSLPNASGNVSWLPNDVVSQTVIDIAFAPQVLARALNIVHPCPILWSTIMEAAADIFVEAGITVNRLTLVPMQSWADALIVSSINANTETFERFPALKLIAFFNGISRADTIVRSRGMHDPEGNVMTQFATSKAQHFSPALRSALPLGAPDVRRWLRYWTARGLFNST